MPNAGALLPVALGTMLAGCAVTGSPDPSPSTAATPAASPVVICLVDDKSGSAPGNLVPQFTQPDLEQMVELVSAGGGEIAVGLILDRPELPLLRLAVEPPPCCAPPAPLVRNRFKRREMMDEYNRARAELDDRQRAWKEQSARQQSTFVEQVLTLLDQKRTRPRTALCGALRQVATFLEEQRSLRDPRYYALLLTDGINNVDRCEPSLDPAQVLIVNSLGELGMFADTPTRRFEAVPSALTWIRDDLARPPAERNRSAIR